MNRQKVRRAWAATKIKHPVLAVFGTNRKVALLLAAPVVACVMYLTADLTAVLPDELRTDNSLLQNMLSFVIEVFAVLLFACALLFCRTVSFTESERIDPQKRTRFGEPVTSIADNLTLPLPPDCRFVFDKSDFFEMPKVLASSYRWAEFDREEFYLVKAGALDKPKLALRRVRVEGDRCCFELGAASFYDIFFMTYSPDLLFSTQSAQESGEADSNTVRGVLGNSLDLYYSKSFSFADRQVIALSDLMPNPMGLSGIIVIECDGERSVLLRNRGAGELSNQGFLEWSFAGLLEAADFLHSETIELDELVQMEFQDEVARCVPTLARDDFNTRLLGMTLNPLFLYQPEIYVLLSVQLTKDELQALRDDVVKTHHEVAPLKSIGVRFEAAEAKGRLKNLCPPGLSLLRRAEPSWFS